MQTFGIILMALLICIVIAFTIFMGIKVGKEIYVIIYTKKHGHKPEAKAKKVKKNVNEADL